MLFQLGFVASVILICFCLDFCAFVHAILAFSLCFDFIIFEEIAKVNGNNVYEQAPDMQAFF